MLFVAGLWRGRSLLAVSCVAWLAGCGQRVDAPDRSARSSIAPRSAQAVRPLRIALYDDPLTLDPHQRNQLLTFTVLRNIYEALTAFDAGAKVGPSLAESWENPSDLCWIFRLRRGVRFHDGHELTAEDVLYSFERARHMPKSNVGGYLVSIDRVRAVDRYTVEVTTTQPFPVLLNKLAFILIVPAGSPEEIDHPVGTGPYRLESYTPKKRLSLAAFADYWGGMPPERRVEFVPEPDLERRIQALIAGEVDIIQEPGAANIERIRGAPGTKIVVQDSLAAVFLLLRPDRPPFDDPRVRRAVDLALDRRALVRNVLHGEGTPLGQMVGRNVFGYAPDLEPTLPDLDQARALLAASGHAGGLDVEAPYRSGRGPELEAVREQLARVGIRLHPSERPWVELFPQLLSGDQDLYFGAWFCLSADASDLFDAMVHTRDAVRGYGASNFNRFSNPQLDEGIEQTSRTLDLLNRRHGLESCMRLLMADHSFLPLYSPSVLFGVRENVDWQLRRDGLVLAKGISRHPEIG